MTSELSTPEWNADKLLSLYKGLYPLWGRQIPYTMMKFASFETIVEAIYGRMPGKKSDYGRGTQTAVSFAGGYLGKSEESNASITSSLDII